MSQSQLHGLGKLAERIYTLAENKSRQDRLVLVGALVGREIHSTKELTQDEVNRLLRLIPKPRRR